MSSHPNGSLSIAGSFTLSGTILPNDVVVITNGDTDTSGPFGYCDPALYNLGDLHAGPYPSPMHFNGNDALVLLKNGSPIDIFGKVGEDPGYAWTDDATAGFTDANGGTWWTANHTLVRKPSILNGVSQNPIVFNPTLEWDSLPNETYTGLGTHQVNCINGCTDSNAINYNILATLDDGSCIFSCFSSNCTDYLCPPEGSNLNDGFVGLPYQSFINFSIPLDTSISLSGVNVNVTISNVDVDSVIGLPNNFFYSCSPNPNTCSFVGGSNGCLELYSLSSPLVSDTGVYHIQIVTSTLVINVPLIGSITQLDTIDYYLEIKNNTIIGGCTDSIACNFNSLANFDDGSCVYNQSNLIVLTQCNSYVWDGVT